MYDLYGFLFCLEKNTAIHSKNPVIFPVRTKHVFAGILGITTAYNKVFECIIHKWLLDKKVLQTYSEVNE